MSLLMKWVNKSYIWLTERLYHRFAWAYDFTAWLVSFGTWSDWRRDALNYLGSGRVLEFGFGTGVLMSEMTNLGYKAYGLEPSPQMIKVAKQKAKVKGITLKIVQGKAEKLPFPKASFDNLISTFPSKYIYQDETMKNMERVLTSDGRVVITGIGVEFRSGLRNFLTGWLLNKGSHNFIKWFCQKAKNYGFITSVVQHREKAYILPIIIMEKSNEN